MSILDGVTLAIAVLGATLGLVNTWHALDKDRVKLRVTPKMAYPVGMLDDRPRLCIEVLNRSSFPVTVREVGFNVRGSTSRIVVMRPLISTGADLPLRLEPRTAFTAYVEPGFEKSAQFQSATRAFARTDCEETGLSSRRAVALLQ